MRSSPWRTRSGARAYAARKGWTVAEEHICTDDARILIRRSSVSHAGRLSWAMEKGGDSTMVDWYTARGMVFEAVFGRPVLPVGERTPVTEATPSPMGVRERDPLAVRTPATRRLGSLQR
jgi:hypothetical protein